MATLRQYSKGLIASSACLSGKLDRLLLDGNFESACAHAREMESIFGKGNYFVEIMDHDLEDEKRVIPLLVQVSRETGIPLLATNDCHYLRREDADAQEVLMCIQTGKTLDDTNRMRMETRELYVKSEDEMRRVCLLYTSKSSALSCVSKIIPDTGCARLSPHCVSRKRITCSSLYGSAQASGGLSPNGASGQASVRKKSISRSSTFIVRIPQLPF